MTNYLILYLFLFLLNFFIFYNLKKISSKINIYDKPSSIKYQKKPVPSTGGIFLFINLVIALIYLLVFNYELIQKTFFIYDFKQLIIFLFSLFFIFLVGLYDDKFGLNANQKLFMIIPLLVLLIYVDEGLKVSQITFTFNSLNIDLNRTSIIFSALCFLTYLNCINMFDGINLQTSLTIIGMLTIFQIYLNIIDPILIAIIFYLIYFSFNNYKSKIYLGDSGSLILAFILGYILIKSHNILFVKSDIIFSFTIFHFSDMARLIIKRLFNGKHPFSGDNDHIHHRLVKKVNLNYAIIITFGSVIIPLALNIFTNFSYNLLIMILSVFNYIFLIIFTSDKKNFKKDSK